MHDAGTTPLEEYMMSGVCGADGVGNHPLGYMSAGSMDIPGWASLLHCPVCHSARVGRMESVPWTAALGCHQCKRFMRYFYTDPSGGLDIIHVMIYEPPPQ